LFTSHTFDEVYYLAAKHRGTFDSKDLSQGEILDVNFTPVIEILEIIKNQSTKTKFFYANSILMYGNNKEKIITEELSPQPKCAYGLSKLLSFNTIKFYREVHGLYAVNAILLNHESHRRKEGFLTNKLLNQSLEISQKNLSKKIVLHNPLTNIDLGYAPDFTKVFHKIMQAQSPQDFIVCTGKMTTIKEYASLILKEFDLTYSEHVTEVNNQEQSLQNNGFHASNQKVKNEINWDPLSELKEWIPQMCQKFKRDNKK
jgi:GDPmannose 4,6-dehydratase